MEQFTTPVPPVFKQLQHFLKTANEHENRDPVVSYYCRLYAMQQGIEIDKKSPEARTFLVSLMGYLEKVKQESSLEGISNEIVGQAHMEHYALQMFLHADNEDRAGRFGKNVVKSFYTAGILFDVLTNFGEVSEDIDKNRKYAKWKAAYIHRCLKDGDTPIPGPAASDDIVPGENINQDAGPSGGAGGTTQPVNPGSNPTLPTDDPHSLPTVPSSLPDVPSQPTVPVAAPITQPSSVTVPQTNWQPPANAGSVQLTPEQYQQAMKFCKYAGSALQYEDNNTAIDNLTKALKLLTTGNST